MRKVAGEKILGFQTISGSSNNFIDLLAGKDIDSYHFWCIENRDKLIAIAALSPGNSLSIYSDDAALSKKALQNSFPQFKIMSRGLDGVKLIHMKKTQRSKKSIK